MAENGPTFCGCCVYIIPKCIGPKRYRLFQNQIIENGGTMGVKDDPLTHVVYDESLPLDDPEIQYFLTVKNTLKVVCTRWLSECIKNKKLIPVNEYLLKPSKCQGEAHLPISDTKESKLLKIENVSSKKPKLEVVSQSELENHVPEMRNTKLIAELNKLSKSYRSLGDVYRARHYTSAVSIIQKHSKEIVSYEEALAINGITSHMASKIGEILDTGCLRRVKELCDNEKVIIIERFTQIWGVGPATADNWYRQGLRTIDDVKSKCSLTKMQQIGIKYLNDFKKTIPRPEIEKIIEKVTEATLSIDLSAKLEPCGSYRRGKLLCGDIDLVIFVNNEGLSCFMEKLLKKLVNVGFISEEFSSIESTKHHKFLGICKLPCEDSVFRRIDIFIAPFSEYAPAMIHYTGSANFNIALRQHAMKKGLHLSENGLFDKFVKQGNSVLTTGDPLPTPNEESIFGILELPYRKPEDRETRVISNPNM